MGAREGSSTEACTWQEAGKNKRKSAAQSPISKPPAPPQCPQCGSSRVWKDGLRYVKTETGELAIQRYICRDCGHRFSETDPSKKSYSTYNHTIGRQVCVTMTEGTKNLSHQRTRIEKQAAGATKLSEAEIRGKLIEYMWHLKKQGYAEATIQGRTKVLKTLVKRGADLWNPEHVKKVIAEQETWSSGTKHNAVLAYNSFCHMEGLTWELPRYKRRDTLPFVPLESELDLLIRASARTISIFLESLKETGGDPGEVLYVKWTDLNEESKTLSINHPVKGHNARILSISKELVGRLKLLPKRSERIFPTTMNSLHQNFWKQRKRIARDFDNPRLLEVTFTSFRHWKATAEYHRTKDILYVKQLLGHKTLSSTLIYIDIEKAVYGSGRDDEYTIRVAETIEEDQELLEAGFEYVTDRDNVKLYRKRK